MCSKRMNIALLSRWLWLISQGHGGPWLDIIRNKYLCGQPLAFCQRSGGSQFWQSVIQLLPVLRIDTSISVGFGALTLFWFDRWLGDSPWLRDSQNYLPLRLTLGSLSRRPLLT